METQRWPWNRQDGFTLIELLVVVVIIGILASIAIAVFLSQRERAWAAELESDVRNTALEVFAEATSRGGVPLPPAGVNTLPTVVDGFGSSAYFYDVAGDDWCLAGQRADTDQLAGIVIFDTSGGLISYDESSTTLTCTP